jgi:hypothetical protein
MACIAGTQLASSPESSARSARTAGHLRLFVESQEFLLKPESRQVCKEAFVQSLVIIHAGGRAGQHTHPRARQLAMGSGSGITSFGSSSLARDSALK